MRADFRTKTESTKEHVPIRKQVPLSFKKQALGRIAYTIPLAPEKTNKDRLFGAALAVAKMTGDKLPRLHDAGVGGEDHIRASLFLRDRQYPDAQPNQGAAQSL